MRHRFVGALGGAVLLALLAGAPVLAGNPSGTGQPNASCEVSSLVPNGFGTDGFANAESQYAGSGDPSMNAASTNAVSQYDVACYQISLHH